eukprot:gene35207-19181_t
MSSGDAIAASIRCSFLWRQFRTLSLTKRIRDAGDPEYSEWVDTIGNGTAGEAAGPSGSVRHVTLPRFKQKCLECSESGRPCRSSIAAFTDEHEALEWLARRGHSGDLRGRDEVDRDSIAAHGAYWCNRAVLSPHNAQVDELNARFLDD